MYKRQIEYCIGEQFWGNGYAGEALTGLIEFIFGHTEFLKLEAYHRSENAKSGRVLEKSQMYITDTVERFVREHKLPVGEAVSYTHLDVYKRQPYRTVSSV